MKEITCAQQKKIERMRQKVVELYNLADSQRGDERSKTQRLWIKANNELDAYQDKVFK